MTETAADLHRRRGRRPDHLRRPGRPGVRRCRSFMFASPMDATGVRRPWPSHFTGPAGGHLRPARRRPQPDRDRRSVTPEQHADGPAPGDRGARRRAGGLLRHQRRRGQRCSRSAAAHPERRTTAWSRTSRRPSRTCPTAARVLAALDDMKATYRDRRQRPGDGEVHRAGDARRRAHRGLPATGRRRTRRCSACRARTTADRDNPLMRNMPACNVYEVDVDALRALGDRLVVAVGAESGERARPPRRPVGRRAARARPVTEFPSDHAGFLGGEHGQHRRPGGFGGAAARGCSPAAPAWLIRGAATR